MSILFKEVSKSFAQRRILDQVSFEVKTGEILFIIGKSGVGKSVTLKHIIGLLAPDSGQVLVNGKDVCKASPRELEGIRRECGMIFQHPALFDSLSIFENIAFGLRQQNFKQPVLRERVREKLKLVHLQESILDKLPSQISFGMQKRVAIARTLAPEPKYLLFDEPTTGLDPVTTQAVNDLIKELSTKLNVTSVVVSHDMDCALKAAHRILVLDQGKVLANLPCSEVRKSTIPLVKEFMRETLEREGMAS